jgi:hypothetical protein
MTELDPRTRRMVEAIYRAIVAQATAEVEALGESFVEAIRQRARPTATVKTILRDEQGRITAIVEEPAVEEAADVVDGEEPAP